MKKIFVYAILISSTFGANFLSISMGLFQMTLYRFLLICAFLFVILKKNHFFYYDAYENNFLIILLVYSLLSIVIIKDINSFIKYEFYIVAALMVQIVLKDYIDSLEKMLGCLKAFNISIIIQAAIGGFEYIKKTYFYLDENLKYLYTRFGNFPPVAMLYNTNNFALLMLFGVTICLALIINETSIIKKCALSVEVIVLSVLIYLTTSRAALIGLFIVLLILLYLFEKNTLRRIVFLCVGLGLLTFFMYRNSQYLNISFYSDSSREKLILNGLAFTIKTFGFGIGTGQSSYWLTNNAIFDVEVNAFHNWWIEILASYGIFIFMYYVFVYGSLINSSFKMMRSDNRNFIGLGLGSFALLTSFFVSSITVSNIMSLEWFWIVWALVIIEKKLYKNLYESNSMSLCKRK